MKIKTHKKTSIEFLIMIMVVLLIVAIIVTYIMDPIMPIFSLALAIQLVYYVVIYLILKIFKSKKIIIYLTWSLFILPIVWGLLDWESLFEFLLSWDTLDMK